MMWRRSDGECNNLERRSLGSSQSAYKRLLPPAYSDSQLNFRLSVSGSALPSARAVSDRLAGRGGPGPGSEMTGNAMQWGQFLTHDLGHTPELAASHLTDCCGEDSDHPACAPITISSSDSLYGEHNKTCINFIRSALTSSSCPTTEQKNQVTSYIDGSMIYGSDQQTTDTLREFQGGRLTLTGGILRAILLLYNVTIL